MESDILFTITRSENNIMATMQIKRWPDVYKSPLCPTGFREADPVQIWNPIQGCSQISEGCQRCWALRLNKTRPIVLSAELHKPHHWRKNKKIYVCTEGDMFHTDVSSSTIYSIFDIASSMSRHRYYILTRRPQRALNMVNSWMKLRNRTHMPSHFAFGTSIELDKYVWRADILRKIPAKELYLSVAPLLGPILHLNLSGIAWVIAAGEFGESARKCNLRWFRKIRDDCVKCNVDFIIKTLGSHLGCSQTLDGKSYKEDADNNADTKAGKEG